MQGSVCWCVPENYAVFWSLVILIPEFRSRHVCFSFTPTPSPLLSPCKEKAEVTPVFYAETKSTDQSDFFLSFFLSQNETANMPEPDLIFWVQKADIHFLWILLSMFIMLFGHGKGRKVWLKMSECGIHAFRTKLPRQNYFLTIAELF